MVTFTPRPLYPQGKSSWYPLDRRLGGSQSRSGRDGEEKNSQLLPGLEPPFIQPVAQRWTTELYRKIVNVRGPFAKFVDSPYYSESELCGGAVTVFFRSSSLSKRCTYNAPPTSRKRAADR
jgi:hypothetical protein